MKTTESPVWTSLEPFGVWGWSFFRWYTQKSLLYQGSLGKKSLSYQGSLGKKSLLDQGPLAVDRWPSPECEDLVNFSDFLLTDRWPGPDPLQEILGFLGQPVIVWPIQDCQPLK